MTNLLLRSKWVPPFTSKHFFIIKTRPDPGVLKINTGNVTYSRCTYHLWRIIWDSIISYLVTNHHDFSKSRKVSRIWNGNDKLAAGSTFKLTNERMVRCEWRPFVHSLLMDQCCITQRFVTWHSVLWRYKLIRSDVAFSFFRRRNSLLKLSSVRLGSARLKPTHWQ